MRGKEQNQREGGPPKPKRGRQKSLGVTTGQLFYHISTLSLLPRYRTSKSHDPSRFCAPQSPVQLTDFLCKTCNKVTNQPVGTVCGNMSCKMCVCTWLQSKSAIPTCPCCSATFTSTKDVRRASTIIRTILPKLKVHCDNDFCSATVTLENLQQHVESCSSEHASRVLLVQLPRQTPPVSPSHNSSNLSSPLSTPSTSKTPSSASSSPSGLSFHSLLESPLDKTPTKAEKTVATRLVKRINVV